MKDLKLIGSIVKVHKIKDITWVRGMNKYDKEIGEVIDGIRLATHELYIIDGFNGKRGKPYLFLKECLEVV